VEFACQKTPLSCTDSKEESGTRMNLIFLPYELNPAEAEDFKNILKVYEHVNSFFG